MSVCRTLRECLPTLGGVSLTSAMKPPKAPNAILRMVGSQSVQYSKVVAGSVSWFLSRNVPSLRARPVVSGQPSEPSGNWVELTLGGKLGRVASNLKTQTGLQALVSSPSSARACQEKRPDAVVPASARRSFIVALRTVSFAPFPEGTSTTRLTSLSGPPWP